MSLSALGTNLGAHAAMNAPASISADFAADIQALGDLKLNAGNNNPDSIKETAKQFESLFMRELMKSMRQATMKSGMLDNPGTDLGMDLLDSSLPCKCRGSPAVCPT